MTKEEKSERYAKRHSEIISRLRKIRKRMNFTQEQLAQLLDTKQARISVLETGKKKLDVVYFLTIMEVMKCKKEDVRFVLYGPKPKEKRVSLVKERAKAKRARLEKQEARNERALLARKK